MLQQLLRKIGTTLDPMYIYLSTAALLSSVWLKKINALHLRAFSQKFPMVVCCISVDSKCKHTPNGCKNQSNDTFKVYTWPQLNQEFFKQENVAVHHCGFKLKCSKHFYCCFGQTLVNFINVTVVMQNWNNIGSNVYVHRSPIIHHLVHKKINTDHLSVF